MSDRTWVNIITTKEHAKVLEAASDEFIPDNMDETDDGLVALSFCDTNPERVLNEVKKAFPYLSFLWSHGTYAGAYDAVVGAYDGTTLTEDEWPVTEESGGYAVDVDEDEKLVALKSLKKLHRFLAFQNKVKKELTVKDDKNRLDQVGGQRVPG